jgi:hypothetical protein
MTGLMPDQGRVFHMKITIREALNADRGVQGLRGYVDFGLWFELAC